MNKITLLVLLGIGAGATAYAATVVAPEISPASGGSAVALFAGALIMIRGRRRS